MGWILCKLKEQETLKRYSRCLGLGYIATELQMIGPIYTENGELRINNCALRPTTQGNDAWITGILQKTGV